MSEPRFTAASAREQILEIMRAFGADAQAAEICTEVMFHTDLSGIDSHGISMLPIYHQEIAEGSIDPVAAPVVEHDHGASVLIDARAGFGHLAGHAGMRQAMAKAREYGIGLATVHRANHYGAAGYYAIMAAREGLIGLSMCSTRGALQTPTGARHPFMGTNPIGFAAPAGDDEPVVLDMATTTVPLNKVKVHELTGRQLGPDWVTDTTGTPARDAAAAYGGLTDESGNYGLSPLGGPGPQAAGHKGYGLATMVQILSAALGGADQPGSKDGFHDVGYTFIAIDPGLVNPADPAAGYTAQLREDLRAAAPLDPAVPVQVAGDPQIAHRADRSAHGIPLAARLTERLAALCADLGCRYLLQAQPLA